MYITRCRLLLVRASFTLLASLWLVPVNAQLSGIVPSNPEPLIWLKSGQYSAVEHYYAELQRDFESGSTSEEQLKQAYRDIDEGISSNGQFFDGWIAAFPKSYAARTARGAYYYRMAWSSRGGEYIEQTAPQQIDAMARFLALSMPDLKASLQMTPKPYISTLYLLNVAMLNGSPDERRQWLDLGNRIDPENTLLRTRYMIGLTPKWGGSYRQMRAFLGECRRQRLPEMQLIRLNVIVHTEIARGYRQAGNTSLAFEQWDTVLKLSQSVGDPPTAEALIGYARAAWDLRQREEADNGLRQLAEMSVHEDWILSQMAWIYVAENRMAEGWKFLQEAASLNDAWAQYGVAKTTYLGCVDVHLAPDPDAARVLMQRSAQNGNLQARTFLNFDAWGHVFGWLYLILT